MMYPKCKLLGIPVYDGHCLFGEVRDRLILAGLWEAWQRAGPHVWTMCGIGPYASDVEEVLEHLIDGAILPFD